MVLWLLLIVNSATSLTCFLLGVALMLALSLSRTPRPATVHLMMAGMVFAALFASVFFNAYANVVEALGRDNSLSGRTELWDEVLRMTTHPWVGAGFESFFLGGRLEYLWRKYWWHPNEAHNGYLELYLNLGWIGVGFFVLLVISGYRHVVEGLRRDSGFATLKLVLLVIAIVYNLTEAAFKVMHPVWILFLLATAALPTNVIHQPDSRKEV
jgi:O-antigen ligase